MNLNLECIQADSAIEKQKHRTVRNLWTIVGIAAALVVSACGGKKSVSPEDYPVAVAAADSSVVTLGKQVTLIGRGSYDPKGKQLLFHWSQGTTNPSPVVFSANDSQNASAVQVTLDQAGTYAFALVVESEKGLKSLPDTVVVTAKKWELNTAEHKQTGSYFKISNKEQGEETEDRAPVTIQWRFISYIVARGAVQISGEYTLTWQNPNSRSIRITTSQLEFVDTLETKIAKHDISPKDDFVLAAGATKTRTGTFTTSLSAPEISDQVSRMNVWGSVEYTAGVLANAGPDQTVTTEETVRLDGSGSRDEGGQPLNYWWSGDISLDDEYMARPSFIANTAGTFRFWLGAFVKCCGCGVSVSCMIKPRFSVRHQRILHRR